MVESFLSRTQENANLNQYWYSQKTIDAIVQEIETNATCAAFISTPSVFFSLTEGTALRSVSKVFDIDEQWISHPCFVRYDYRIPEAIPAELHHVFDCVVVDPPFITEDVWQKYAVTAKLLLKPGGRILCSTIAENAIMMQKLLGLEPVPFKPSIPNLIYQYNIYTNFDPVVLCQANDEIPE